MSFVPSPINPTSDTAKPSPFIAFTQRVIPATFDESMSYQEALSALLKYIKELQETVDNNALITDEQTKVINEMTDYINNYFDNLDVQEEINHKLDEMAEDGTLAEIVTAYLNVKSILAYNTIAEMSEATNIVEGSFLAVYGLNALNDHVLTFYKARQIRNTDVVDGINLVALADEDLVAEITTNPLISGFATVADMVEANLISEQIVKTLGYHSVGDGGGAFYKIRSITNDDVIDEMTIIEITGNTSNNLIAELIIPTVPNPEIFGAYGDGIHDDKIAIQKCFDTDAKNISLNKSYLISDSVLFKGSYRKISGEATLTTSSNNPALIINGFNLIIEMAQINAPKCIKITANGTGFTWSQYITFQNIDLIATDTCVTCERDATKWVNEIKFENVKFQGLIGVLCVGDSTNQYSYGGFRFTDCGNEICTTAFIKGYHVDDISIVNLRNNEAWDKTLLDISNQCNYFSINSSSLISTASINLSKTFDGKGVILGNAVDSTGGRIGSVSQCYQGVFVCPGDLYTVLTSTNDTFDFSTASSNLLPKTYILRSAGGVKTYHLTLPAKYLSENEFYVINQSVNNKLELNYGNTSKTFNLDKNNMLYKIRVLLGQGIIEEVATIDF